MNTSADLWILVIGMGLITYGLRYGSVMAASRLSMTPLQKTFLRYVPVAVLSAIVFLELVVPDGTLNLSLAANPRLIAGALAIAVCLWTRKILPTVVVGMVSLWILQAIL